MLSKFYNKTKMEGISVIGLAIDSEKNVKEFMQKIKVEHHYSSQEPRALISWRRLD